MSDYVSNHEVHPNAPAGGGGPGRFHAHHSPGPTGGHAHDRAHAAHHYAHMAHQAHLAAEGVEFVAHQLHHVSSYSDALTKAQQVMLRHSKMARDLKLMRRAMKTLENAATKSANAAAATKLVEVKAAYGEMESAYKVERSAVATASKLIQAEHEVRTSFQGAAKIKLGQAILGFEHALQGSAAGRALLKTGKFVANPKFVKGLMIAGAAVEGIAGWIDSNAETTAGKAANAALAAGGGALVMANPIVAGADVVLPKGYKVSEVYQGTAGALTAIGEGIATGDEFAMARFHERSKKGDYGKVMQLSSEAGDYWAEKGVRGGLSEFFDAVKYAIDTW